MGPIRPSNQTIQQISPARQLDQNHLFIGLLDSWIKIIYPSACSTAGLKSFIHRPTSWRAGEKALNSK
jgi:hypothetical protein